MLGQDTLANTFCITASFINTPNKDGKHFNSLLKNFFPAALAEEVLVTREQGKSQSSSQ